MNPLYYSLFIEPGMDQWDYTFFAVMLILMMVAGACVWLYELIKRVRK